MTLRKIEFGTCRHGKSRPETLRKNSSLKCHLKQLAKQGSCANSVILGPQLCLVSNQWQTELLYSIFSFKQSRGSLHCPSFRLREAISTPSDTAETQPRDLSCPGKRELAGRAPFLHSGRRKPCRTVVFPGGFYFQHSSWVVPIAHEPVHLRVFLKHVFCHNISTCCSNTLNISFDAKVEVLSCFWTSRPNNKAHQPQDSALHQPTSEQSPSFLFMGTAQVCATVKTRELK